MTRIIFACLGQQAKFGFSAISIFEEDPASFPEEHVVSEPQLVLARLAPR